MEYLTLNEKTFVKANKIATELGYTADYIGQLCRGGKVEAKLVGRTWYVEEESIRSHKNTRYRSTKAVAKKSLQQAVVRRELEAVSENGYEVSIHRPQYIKHQTATILAPQYALDETDLIPQVKAKKLDDAQKTGRIAVVLAEAEQINVESDYAQTSFTPTEMPEVKFKGKVTVNSAEDEEEVPVENLPEESRESLEVTDDKKLPKSVSIDAVIEEVPLAIENETETKQPVKKAKLAGRRRGHLNVVEDAGSLDSVVNVHHAAEVFDVRWSLKVRAVIFLTALIAGSALGVIFISINHHIGVDSLTIQNGYILDIQFTVELIKLYLYTYLG